MLHQPVGSILSTVSEFSTCLGQTASPCTSVETWEPEKVQEGIES